MSSCQANFAASCQCSDIRAIEEEALKALLPEEYSYALCDFEKESDREFICRFRINVDTKEGIKQWLEEFTISSNTTYKISKTFPHNNVYKIRMHCHHNTQPESHNVKSPRAKHTNCPAQLTLTVKQKNFSRKYKSTDFHLPEMATIVVLKHRHNHRIEVADALKVRSPNLSVKDTFIRMFKEGLTPSKALNKYKSELQEEHGDAYFIVSADRAVCPDIQWVFYVYYQEFKKEYGEAYGSKMFVSLETFISKYNDECGKICSEFLHIGDNFIVVLVSPLMERILEHVPAASEVLFVDSSGCVDRYGSKVFLFMTNSCCGGLPVGCLITSSESEICITTGLNAFKKILSEKSFGGRGKVGPKIIMSDDCAAERNSFSSAFPSATLLLCTFHVLQATWRYLWNAHTGIPMDKRQELYFLVKKMVYASTEESLQTSFETIKCDPIASSYSKFQNYVLKMYERKSAWAICFRKDLMLRGQNTNNICEAAMKVLKNSILQRTKAYSVSQLFHFLSADLSNFYERKLIAAANGRPEAYLKKKMFSDEKLKDLSAVEYNSMLFRVLNSAKKTEYDVEMDIGVCSCPMGTSGAFCKHQQFLLEKFNICLHSRLPVDATKRKKLLYVATGIENTPKEWFEPLCYSSSENSNAQSNIVHSNEKDDVEVESFTMENGNSSEHINNAHEKDNVEESVIIKKFESAVREISKKAAGNPDILNSIKKFVKSYENIRTEASLVSSLSTFGKFTGFLERKRLTSSKKIGVQSTALARRKTAGGGRLCVQTGRPPKRSYAEEHSYHIKKAKSTILPVKRMKAPHSLAHCVEENINLGKTH